MLPLYAIGEVDWLTSQSLYHALPEMDEEGIVLCWPRTPYVSIGCHQDWGEFDPLSGIPVVRRKVGGSLVYLDRQQVFFQVVLDPARGVCARQPGQWYRAALDPVVRYLASLGLDATLKPPADILVGGRKISGNAGGQLEHKVVVVGNVLLRFSPDAMASVRSVPNAVMRRAFRDSMERHLVTLGEWPGTADLTPDEVMAGLADAFRRAFDAVPSPVPWARWQDTLTEVGQALTDPGWLHQSGRQARFHEIKVREGVFLRAPRDARYRDVVAEVDVERHRLLQVWGMGISRRQVAAFGRPSTVDQLPVPEDARKILRLLMGIAQEISVS